MSRSPLDQIACRCGGTMGYVAAADMYWCGYSEGRGIADNRKAVRAGCGYRVTGQELSEDADPQGTAAVWGSRGSRECD
jgi:hypothetical protein